MIENYPLSWPGKPERMSNYACVKKWRKSHPELRREQGRRYRQRHPEKASGYSKRYRGKPGVKDRLKIYMADYQRANQSKFRNEKLKHRYGITLKQYEAMLEAQEGLCAICKIKASRVLHVDHCHKTNVVRGLLCNGCNRVLGFCSDNPKILRESFSYLELNRVG